jgi:hypothetical protein
MALGDSSGAELEYTQQLLQLYQLAKHNQSRLDELESAGNSQLRILIRELREADASQRKPR